MYFAKLDYRVNEVDNNTYLKMARLEWRICLRGPQQVK